MASPRLPLSRLTGGLRLSQIQTRKSSTAPPTGPQPQQHDPHALLSKPTWSIRALLPPSSPSSTTTTTPSQPPQITPPQLTHLLRLSALPQPTTPTETSHMLATLHAQLHFVRDMQQVNTDGVEPLAAIRDETVAGQREATVGVATVRAALEAEETHGRCRRPRRRRGAAAAAHEKKEDDAGGGGIEGVEDWDVLGGAGERVGRYFVVRSRKGDVKTH
ncbi:uncharacterized protein B0H64DRAFT_211480 [Chaetomium fimeti]|uniref:Glutamyl-tRNA amidotransferase complex subunit Gta3 domain-containing protein n=1 Tax=Chaetomium fimeti TaxID=1854472 RepID=A0AAE0LPT4_9PEZI|nr:hypothetical protein B0H64DRAFT_211480 [Chaetomium fimeti]